MANPQQGFDHAAPLIGREAFDIGSSPLGREDAHPDFCDCRVSRPETDELGEVPAAIHHGAGDGAVNRDVVTLDVAENAFVGGRLTADVVLWLQTIDRDDELQVRQRGP